MSSLLISDGVFALSEYQKQLGLPIDCRAIFDRINQIAADNEIRLTREFAALSISLANTHDELNDSLSRVGLGSHVPDATFATKLQNFSELCRIAINQWTRPWETSWSHTSSGSHTPSATPESLGSHKTSRDPSPAKQARERDNERCIFTKQYGGTEVAHIFPRSLESRTPEDNAAPAFWLFLKCFLSPEDFYELEQYLLKPGLEGKSKIDRLENMMILSLDTHRAFRSGLIAFEPIESTITPASYTVNVKFLAGREETEGFPAKGRLTRLPTAYKSKDVETDWVFKERCWTDIRTKSIISDGFEFEISTPDPEKFVLPSPILLKLHLAISRIVRLLGGEPDGVGYEDDDDELEESGVAFEDIESKYLGKKPLEGLKGSTVTKHTNILENSKVGEETGQKVSHGANVEIERWLSQVPKVQPQPPSRKQSFDD